MATTFDEIIDLGLTTIQDYKLNEVYKNDKDNFDKITNAFLIRGLPMFYNCKKPLTYNKGTRTFDSDFSMLEKSILADLWVYEWFSFHINNVTQFQNKMSPSDFKHYSEAENLKQKSEYQDKLREKFNQKMVDYGIMVMNLDTWGNYGT